MLPLKVQRYQFNCQTLAPLQLNAYSGSMLRGAFGNALRKQACITNMAQCNQCMLYQQCAYPAVFEAPAPKHAGLQQFSHIPNPFIIEPPPIGEQQLSAQTRFSFNLVLIGQAIEQLPFLITAWQSALKKGLGKELAQVKLQSIVYEPGEAAETLIYQDKDTQLLKPPPLELAKLNSDQTIKLKLITPLHIKKQGAAIKQDITGRDFLMALVRRYYLLQEFYGVDYQAPNFSKLAEQAKTIECTSQLQWYQWQRYSSRQKQKMSFQGMLGELSLTGDLAPFLTLLQKGQWLHVGNKTSFGMGHYQIQAAI